MHDDFVASLPYVQKLFIFYINLTLIIAGQRCFVKTSELLLNGRGSDRVVLNRA